MNRRFSPLSPEERYKIRRDKNRERMRIARNYKKLYGYRFPDVSLNALRRLDAILEIIEQYRNTCPPDARSKSELLSRMYITADRLTMRLKYLRN